MAKLIAIHGKKRSGKGTIGRFLVEQNGFEHVVISRTLKNMTNVLLKNAIDMEKTNAKLFDFTDGDLKEKPILGFNNHSTRDLMIWIGAHFAQSVLSTLWIDITMREIDNYLSKGKSVYVDNIRLFPEFDALKAKGAALWAVVSDYHYKTLPGQNDYLISMNDLTWEQVITTEACQEMIAILFEAMDRSENIAGYNASVCAEFLLSVLSDGVTGGYDDETPPTERPLDLHQFHLLHNTGTVSKLEDDVSNLLRETSDYVCVSKE